MPVAYAIGRRLASERAGTALAALIAVHPLLVYYSQEARGYAAVALACAAGFLCFLGAIEGRRGALGWAIASAVALGCHYFAIFPVAIEAVVLLAVRGRGALPAVAGVAVVGAGLLPLVLQQLDGEHGENVTGTAEPRRAGARRADELGGRRAGRSDRRPRVGGGRAARGRRACSPSHGASGRCCGRRSSASAARR